ncbi:MAG: hypothetical protein ABEI06_10250 [Halobacteriaceae archaeon]
MEFFIFGVILIGGLILPILLYYFVRLEHSKRRSMRRDEAERTARRDTNDNGPE